MSTSSAVNPSSPKERTSMSEQAINAGPAADAAGAAEILTADLYDERGEQLQSVSVQFQSVGGRTRFHGPVRTIHSVEDNALVKAVTAEPGDGAVLVIDGEGSLRTALMGGNIAQAAADNGWAGVIVHGAIRDRTEMARLPLGIKALGSNPKKSAKEGAGEVDAVVTIDGVVFRPGAMVFCDEDGILVER